MRPPAMCGRRTKDARRLSGFETGSMERTADKARYFSDKPESAPL
jgi:hypothetical protein